MKLYNPLFYRFLKGILGSYLNFWLKLEYWEEEALPYGPKVLVVNHPTVWDAFPILAWRDRGFVHVTVEEQIWSYPLPCLAFTLGNQVRLCTEPGKGQGAINDSLHLLGMRNSHSILFSIEGGQTLPTKRDTVRARRGALLLAMEAGCPLIPIGAYLPERNIVRKEFNYNVRGNKYSDISYIPRFRSHYGVQVGKAFYPRESLARDASREEYQAYSDRVLAEVYRLADLAKEKMRGL